MTGMLASVSNLDEALSVACIGVDIIDLKQPARGALGALDITTVRDIVIRLGADTTISATIGDLPMHAPLLADAVTGMMETDVDFIKIGFFPEGDWQDCITRLGEIGTRGHALIAVLFADTDPDFSWIDKLADAGFTGVMLDTMDKHSGSLTQLMPLSRLQTFVHRAQTHSLLSGLAGSLRLTDIDPLMALGADYLGFRGALCRQHDRTGVLDETCIRNIRHKILEDAKDQSN